MMFISISTELISELTGVAPKDFGSLLSLDLHLQRNGDEGRSEKASIRPKIRKIEKLTFFPNLRQLNLSYNAITRIENLDKLTNLVELNLAENAIKKIENLEKLEMLERLNLSGNQIERIPISISSLKRLSHLRLARNLLNVLDDVANLSKLAKLTNLRLDENPFTSSKDYNLFVIFNIPSLKVLDGIEVAANARDNARDKFASNNIELLRNKIATASARLMRLRREIQDDVGRGEEIHPDALESRSLTIKLNEVKQIEAQVDNLQQRLQSLLAQDNRVISVPYLPSDSSDRHEDLEIFSNLNPLPPSPAVGSRAIFGVPPLEVANKTIVDLNDKVEKLASKVLSVEKEKKELTQQLSQRKSSISSVETVKRELIEMEIDLKEALMSAQTANEEANRLRDEMVSLRKQLLQKDTDLFEKSQKIDHIERELKTTKEEHSRNLKLLEECQKSATNFSALDDHRAQEIRLSRISNKLDYEQIQLQNESLKVELDKCRVATNSLNGDILDYMQEIKSLKGKCSDKDRRIQEKDEQLFKQERDLRKMQISMDSILEQSKQLEQENVSLQAKVDSLESELSFITNKAKKDRKSTLGAALPISPKRKVSASYSKYGFEVDSTDSEDLHDVDIQDFVAPLPKFEPNEMDLRAAEIIAYMLLQELAHNPSYRDDRALKDGCLRAAFRIIYSSSQLYVETSEENNVKIPLTPFHALGNKQVLSKWITNAQSGVASLEEAAHVRKELIHMKRVRQELELKIAELDAAYIDKNSVLKSLEQHAIDAKRQAENSLNELENIRVKLQTTKDEFVKIDSEHNLVQRELDLAKYNLKECISLGNIESKNISQLRDRVSQLKVEYENLESSVLIMREAQLKEELKLRSIKQTMSEEIRNMQSDVNRLQNEVKTKRMNMDENEKQHKLQEEEWEIRKKDIDRYLNIKSREVEDELRKLNASRNELRTVKLEIDTAFTKKKQLEYELSQIQDKLHLESARFESEDREVRKKLQNSEKLTLDYEQKCKKLKEKRLLLESECALTQQNLQELKNSCEDIEKSIVLKRKSAEEEYSQLQQQIQTASRNYRQLIGQIEQKQHEYELVEAEFRSTQRKSEDSKRSYNDNEAKLERLQRDIQRISQDHDKLTVELMQQRKDEEVVKQSLLLLKATYDHEEKNTEAVRRKLSILHAEELQLQQSEQKLKSTLVCLKKHLEEQQDELQQTRLTIDRERRDLQELVSKRTLLEGEVNQLNQEFRVLQEKRQSEKVRHQEFDRQILTSVDEMNKIAKQVVAYEEKLDECKRVDEELKARQKATQTNYSKLLLEYEGAQERYAHDKLQHGKLREECTQLNSTLQVKLKEIETLNDQQQAIKNDMDSMKLQTQQLEITKLHLEKEISRYQDFNQLEMKRLENLEAAVLDAQKQLEKTRQDLLSTITNYEKTKLLSAEEARKVEQQRQTWESTTEELVRIDKSIEDARNQLESQKLLTILEIGKLQQAKRSACSDLLQINESRQRLQRSAPVEASILQRSASIPPISRSVSRSIISPVKNSATAFTSSKDSSILLRDETQSDEDSVSSSVIPFQLSTLSKAVANLRAKSSEVLDRR